MLFQKSYIWIFIYEAKKNKCYVSKLVTDWKTWPIAKFLDQDTKHHVIRYLILSRMDYGNVLLYGCKSKDLDWFQALQNKAVKLIFNVCKHDSPAPLLNTLHWLPIRERIKYKLCMYIYKCLNGTAPQYLVDFITYKPKGTRFTCSSIDTTLLTSQYARTSIGDKSFCISGPSLWNSLPKIIREAHTLSGFKKGLIFISILMTLCLVFLLILFILALWSFWKSTL